jgi:hypothetical protein
VSVWCLQPKSIQARKQEWKKEGLTGSAKRIQKELAEISLDPPHNSSAGPKDDNIYVRFTDSCLLSSLLLRSSLAGWLRDLTAAGVEPTPGPTAHEVMDFLDDWLGPVQHVHRGTPVTFAHGRWDDFMPVNEADGSTHSILDPPRTWQHDGHGGPAGCHHGGIYAGVARTPAQLAHEKAAGQWQGAHLYLFLAALKRDFLTRWPLTCGHQNAIAAMFAPAHNHEWSQVTHLPNMTPAQVREIAFCHAICLQTARHGGTITARDNRLAVWTKLKKQLGYGMFCDNCHLQEGDTDRGSGFEGQNRGAHHEERHQHGCMVPGCAWSLNPAPGVPHEFHHQEVAVELHHPNPPPLVIHPDLLPHFLTRHTHGQPARDTPANELEFWPLLPIAGKIQPDRFRELITLPGLEWRCSIHHGAVHKWTPRADEH